METAAAGSVPAPTPAQLQGRLKKAIAVKLKEPPITRDIVKDLFNAFPMFDEDTIARMVASHTIGT